MPPGYHGFYLRIDAGTGTATRVPLPEEVVRQYLGGSGLGARLLLDQGSAVSDPLAPEAPIVFAFSPLVGSPLTTSAKFAVVSKSPLTNRINDSLASSGFALAGKRCGCDAIVIVGRAPELSVLVIDDGDVRLEAADDVRGESCPATEEKLRARLGSDYRIASIGPAGERAVRYATISHDGRHAGRGGSGAVLGSKRIKAIAVRGKQYCEFADPKRVTELSRDLSKRSFGPATAKYRELGTATNLLTFNRFGTLPTRNFQSGTFEEAINLSPQELAAQREKTRASCVACTIGCEHIYAVGRTPQSGAGDPHSSPAGVRVEYESLFALGSLCGVGDSDAVLRASQRCDELGIDTISTGGTIAFAMECVERGLLDESWLRFGDGAAMLRAIELIGRREGIGALLGEGSRRAAEQIGRGSLAFAPQVKGLEIPGYEPRALQTMALGFAVGARGADHNRSGAYEVDFSDKVDRRNATLESVRHAIETEDRAALMDSLILCKFLRGVFTDIYAESSAMLRAVTGWDVTADELRATARRIVAAKHQFNVLAGWTLDEDTLPDRFLDRALPNDPAALLTRESLDALIAEYHRQRAELS
ncbi:MAG TPA: aldehyde ferredoxin oxidoreductase family protein [Vicinamibacterales bacterium]|jgi:aldehyde:ferredoxin oxidoreductase|nr:aldehyde ferredoxin oxidoreductase family protein [Vicinamibacterales bacterium]